MKRFALALLLSSSVYAEDFTILDFDTQTLTALTGCGVFLSTEQQLHVACTGRIDGSFSGIPATYQGFKVKDIVVFDGHQFIEREDCYVTQPALIECPEYAKFASSFED